MSKQSDAVRAQFAAGDAKRDAGLCTPADVIRCDDIVYGADQEWQVLDVYRPRNAKDQVLPVIVSVHGGAWVYGSKEVYQFYCMSLAQRGFAVVNFTYRLAPENKYPASLEDTNLVFAWLAGHAREYGFDPEHVFAVGDSAGAHILGLYAAMRTNPAYAARFSFAPAKGLSLRAVALNCGQYRFEADAANAQTMFLMRDFLPQGGTEEELRSIDVTAHVTGDYPPVFLMTCSHDFLKAQAPPMAQKLAECGVSFLYRFYGTKERPLGHVFHCDMRLPEAKACNDEECAFFRSFCGEAEKLALSGQV